MKTLISHETSLAYSSFPVSPVVDAINTAQSSQMKIWCIAKPMKSTNIRLEKYNQKHNITNSKYIPKP